jgi:putative glutathione S-transferase
MGLLIDGKWQDKWYERKSTGGRFVRKEASYRNWISADGSTGFKAELGRYHLYVSLACPWAHRTLIVRALKGLESAIDVSVVNWAMLEHGWTFADGPDVVPDSINGASMMHQVYTAADSNYTGRVTVPVLWDKKTKAIVNNESSEIIRMLNSAFDHLGAQPGDFYPESRRAEIEEVNTRIYDTVNNGVYKAGFATTQSAYEEAVNSLFDTLDWVEGKLGTSRFLTGNRLTEADIRLFTTLIRFDAVYVGHFKCNLRRIAEYSNLDAYTRDIYQIPGVASTVNFEHIKRHYYESHPSVNPNGIVPLGPLQNFSAPHDRARFNPRQPVIA